MTPPLFEPARIKAIRDTVAESWTPVQLQTRMGIYERFRHYCQEATDDEDFYRLIYPDLPAWALAFLDDGVGKPLFLSRWQCEFIKLEERAKIIWAQCSRKIGKSTVMGVLSAHDICGPKVERIAIFAPTHGQDFVFEDTRKFLKSSPYLSEIFIANDNADRIDAKNGSIINNRSVSQNTGGQTARGEFATRILVDEIQSIQKPILTQIIQPIIADAYSEKTAYYIGTPNNMVNPELESDWNRHVDRSKTDIEYAYFVVDCWRGIEEGCITEKYVRDQKEDLPRSEFQMEYEAKFPDTSQRFYPKALLEGCIDTKLHFGGEPRPGMQYAIAIDWAKYLNNTHIVVGEFHPKTLRMNVVDWTMFNPKERKVDYEEQVEEALRLFWHWNVTWICPDSTSTQDAIIELLRNGSDTYPGIPTARFYGYDPDKDRDAQTLGYKATIQKNDEMHRNHRQQMVKGRIKVPNQNPKEERFFARFVDEHHNLQVKNVSGSQYIRLEEGRGHDKDLAVTMGMLSLYLKERDKRPASFGIAGW